MSSLQTFPYFTEGTIVTGFGRGGKEIGIPTANFEEDVVRKLPANYECGVYYGWAKISNDDNVYKMVQSVGWNPYYKNTLKTMETHLMYKFDNDFYGSHLKVVVLGYIRPMSDYESLDALIAAIQNDIAVASTFLEEPACLKFKNHSFFSATPTTVSGHSSNKAADIGYSDTHVTVSEHTNNPPVHNDKHCYQDHTQSCMLRSHHCDCSIIDNHVTKLDTEKKICENGQDIITELSKDESYYSHNHEELCQVNTGKPVISPAVIRQASVINGLSDVSDEM